MPSRICSLLIVCLLGCAVDQGEDDHANYDHLLPPGHKLSVNEQHVKLINPEPYESWTIYYSDGQTVSDGKLRNLYRKPYMVHVALQDTSKLVNGYVTPYEIRRLAQRSKETGQKEVAVVLYTLSADMEMGLEPELAQMVGTYAQQRHDQLKRRIKGGVR